MKSTVVGSYPVELKEPSNFKDKILKTFGAYDPFKESIKNAVFSQLDAGIDIISDGQVRGDMVSSFSKYIPGFKIEEGNTYIVSKIRNPTGEISVNDLLHAKKLIKEYYGGNIPDGKGIKGIITGPSTIIHSSRITAFYKEKDDAIIDLAHSLKKEVDAIESKVKPVYIQDFEFAGNNVNLGILENNIDLFKGKKIGFGCIDSAKNEVDSFETTQELIEKGVNIVGVDDILLDPDCGLRRAPMDVAFNKLKLINDIKSKYQ